MRRTVDGGLTRQLLKHLGGTGESVTRFTDGDVQNELLNLKLPHGVAGLLGGHFCGCFATWSAASSERAKSEVEQGRPIL